MTMSADISEWGDKHDNDYVVGTSAFNLNETAAICPISTD